LIVVLQIDIGASLRVGRCDSLVTRATGVREARLARSATKPQRRLRQRSSPTLLPGLQPRSSWKHTCDRGAQQPVPPRCTTVLQTSSEEIVHVHPVQRWRAGVRQKVSAWTALESASDHLWPFSTRDVL